MPLTVFYYLHILRASSTAKQAAAYVLYMPSQKAYGYERELAWKVLLSPGPPQHLGMLIASLHCDTKCALQANVSSPISWCEEYTGSKQGDVNAPSFLNIFIDTLIRSVEHLLKDLRI